MSRTRLRSVPAVHAGTGNRTAAAGYRWRNGRAYLPVMDVDGPLLTTCQGCGAWDYVQWVNPNGFEFCPDCCADMAGEL